MINIGNFSIEAGKVFIVAELSANHQQSYELAEKSIIAAKEAGADAVKLQTYTPDTITIDCDSDLFVIKDGLWAGKKLYELYQSAYTPWEWHGDLKKLANSLGMELFSSPFDESAVDFLDNLNIPALKIASFELVDISIIKKAASCGRPIILSTGMAELREIEEAINACYAVGNKDIILLKCTSAYPAKAEDANLATMLDMKDRFGLMTGLSDHTPGIAVPIAAAAMGAVMIEKHFILDRQLGGPDAAFSLEPAEFKAMTDAAREASKAVGQVDYTLSPSAISMRKLARSLFIVTDVPEGELLTNENVRSIRPSGGLHPRHLPEVLGKKAIRALMKGEALSWDMVNLLD